MIVIVNNEVFSVSGITSEEKKILFTFFKLQFVVGVKHEERAIVSTRFNGQS